VHLVAGCGEEGAGGGAGGELGWHDGLVLVLVLLLLVVVEMVLLLLLVLMLDVMVLLELLWHALLGRCC
jgi:hypothetical protein